MQLMGDVLSFFFPRLLVLNRQVAQPLARLFGLCFSAQRLQSLVLQFHLFAQTLAFDQIANAVARDSDIDRFDDKVCRPQREAGHFGIKVVQGGHKYDRYVFECGLCRQSPKGLKTIHLGHHDIEQNQVGRLGKRQRHAGLPRGSELHFKLAIEHSAK